jgi:phage baseplate assembly protein W
MNTTPDPRAFRGKGLAFPLAITPQGKIATAQNETKIEQAMWLILSTAPGERLMRPSYGCGVHDLVFQPNTPQTAARIVDQVRSGLSLQEPRISVLDVTSETSADDPSLLLIRVDYRINSNNSIANIVYPFFITEGA